MKWIALLFLLINEFYAAAQNLNDYQTHDYTYKSIAKVNLKNLKIDFMPSLQNLEAPIPGGSSYHDFLNTLKSQYKNEWQNKSKTSSAVVLGEAESPKILQGFEANEFDGSVPTDNDIAISNQGMLVTVANSTIYIYDTNLDSLMKIISLEAFSDTLGIPNNKFDPKIRYDPKQDRFIMVFLSGNNPSATNIIVAFSASNNPLNDWFLYALDGNPIADTVWSDYPIIALSDDELFITVNLLRERDPNDTRTDAWKFLFDESIIWQINKNSGFSGSTLQTRVYDNIRFSNRPIRNLCPIQGGKTTTGPNIYVLSNRNFDAQNDTLFIVEIDGTLDDPNTQLKIDFRKLDTPYGLAPDALQANNHILQTNDSRILGGFIENNNLHFVSNTVNPDTFRAAIYHGIISDINGSKTANGNVIGMLDMDFGYPNISYTGKFDGDNEAIISFNHSSVDSFAGFSALFYNEGKYSDRLVLKSGDSFVNVLNGTTERWGDYSGTQLKYNEPGKVYVSGFFGTRRILTSRPLPAFVNWSWVSVLESPDSATISSVKNITQQKKINAFPNPSSDKIQIEFELEKNQFLQFDLMDTQGKTIKTLLKDSAKKGKNIFTFSLSALNSGVYFIRVFNEENQLMMKRIVKP